MDLSINKPVKDILKKEFHQWYTDETSAQGEQYTAIKLPLSVMKPLGAKWLMKAFDHIQSQPTMIKNGFKAAGITDVIDKYSKKAKEYERFGNVNCLTNARQKSWYVFGQTLFTFIDTTVY